MEDNCSNLNDDQYDTLVAVNISFSAISCVLVLCMIGIIVLFKKYQFFSQRLILYVAVTSFIYSLTNAVNFFGREARKNPVLGDVCVAMGFAGQVTFWWEFMAVIIIMVDIFIKITFKRRTEKLELLYCLSIVFIPLLFSWIPFIKMAYGPAEFSCWIREHDFTTPNCTRFDFGIYLRFSLFYVPLYVLLFLLFLLLLATCCIIRKRRKEWNIQSELPMIDIGQILEKEIRSLFAYPVIFIITNIAPLAHRIYGIFSTGGVAYFVLSLVTSISFGIQGSITMLAFTLDPETIKKLRWIEIKAAISRWRGKEEGAVSEYLVGRSERSDSLLENKTNINYTIIV